MSPRKVALGSVALAGFFAGLMIAFLLYSFDATEVVLILAVAALVCALNLEHDAGDDAE